MYQCLLMILLSLSTLAYAKTDNNMSLEDIAKQQQQQIEQQAKFDQWHRAGLRWFTVGTNLVFIFQVSDFYTEKQNKVILKQRMILQDVANWLRPIPKTWVRISGVRQQTNDASQAQQLAHNDARALAGYFWDHNIDARGIYTTGIIEPTTQYLSLSRPKQVEMVIGLLPIDSSLR